MHTDRSKKTFKRTMQRKRAKLRKKEQSEGKPDLTAGKGSRSNAGEGSPVDNNAEFTGTLIGSKAKLENSPAGKAAVHESLFNRQEVGT